MSAWSHQAGVCNVCLTAADCRGTEAGMTDCPAPATIDQRMRVGIMGDP